MQSLLYFIPHQFLEVTISLPIFSWPPLDVFLPRLIKNYVRFAVSVHSSPWNVYQLLCWSFTGSPFKCLCTSTELCPCNSGDGLTVLNEELPWRSRSQFWDQVSCPSVPRAVSNSPTQQTKKYLLPLFLDDSILRLHCKVSPLLEHYILY